MWKVKRIHTTPFLVGLGMELTACVFVVYSSPSLTGMLILQYNTDYVNRFCILIMRLTHAKVTFRKLFHSPAFGNLPKKQGGVLVITEIFFQSGVFMKNSFRALLTSWAEFCKI